MYAGISYPKKDKPFCSKEQTKGLTSCWMDANAANDELGIMRRRREIEMVVKNKISGNIKKAIQQGLACKMVGKGAEGLFLPRLAFFCFHLLDILIGLNIYLLQHLIQDFFISFFLLLNEMTQRRAG